MNTKLSYALTFLTLLALFCTWLCGGTVTRCLASQGAVESEIDITEAPVVGGDSANLRVAPHFVYDFGVLNADNPPRLEHTFVLFNRTQHDVFIDSVDDDSFWIKTILGNGNESKGKLLSPGGRVNVHVSVDYSDMPFDLSGAVTVCARGKTPIPIAIIELRGIKPSVLEVSPRYLDFGVVHGGATPKLVLTVSLNAPSNRLGSFPPFICSNPDIIFGPMPGFQTIHGTQVAKYKIEVSVSPHAKLGELTGEIKFATKSSDSSLADRSPSVAQIRQYHLENTSILVLGEVDGTISSTPKVLVIPAVDPGKPMLGSFKIKGQLSALKDLKIKSASKWLTFAVGGILGAKAYDSAPNANGGDPPFSVQVDVTISNDAPAWLFDSEIDITDPAGETLAVPVVGYVEK